MHLLLAEKGMQYKKEMVFTHFRVDSYNAVDTNSAGFQNIQYILCLLVGEMGWLYILND